MTLRIIYHLEEDYCFILNNFLFSNESHRFQIIRIRRKGNRLFVRKMHFLFNNQQCWYQQKLTPFKIYNEYNFSDDRIPWKC